MNINCSELDNINIAYDSFFIVKQIGEEFIKYLRGYRQVFQEYNKNLQIFENTFAKKLSKAEEKSKFSHILDITNKAKAVIFQSIELFQFSFNEIDAKINKFEEILKEKTEIVNSIKKTSLYSGKSLISSYNEVNKTKNAFINSISKTEEIIDKYYNDKKKIQQYESGLGSNLNENEYNKLKEQLQSQISEMNASIKLSKKYEDFHKGSISACKKLNDKFKEDCFKCSDEIKANACQISSDLKELVCSFMLLYKNIYKQPLSFIDVCIDNYNSLDEQKEMDNIITSNFKNDNELKYKIATKYKLKSISYLKHNNYLKNNEGNKEEEKEFNNKENNMKNINKNLEKRNLIEIIEDGFDEISYISDESLIMTIKSLFDNFELIDKNDIDIKLEEGKNKAQKYILKIISNMNSYPFAKEGSNTGNIELNQKCKIDYKREELKNEELMDLIGLLNNHENRIIFLNRLNDYRGKGKFILCNKDYILLSQLFNIICDKIKKDLDYHAAEMVIVLSETYYIYDGKKKKYLQESFKGNKIFKEKNFWEEFLCYSINKEIMKTLKREEKIREDKEISDHKYSNVVFSQILTLIDNMFEFELEPNIIREILNPKISSYRLNNDFKQTINAVIEAKMNQTMDDK